MRTVSINVDAGDGGKGCVVVENYEEAVAALRTFAGFERGPIVVGWMIRFTSTADDPHFYGLNEDHVGGITGRDRAIIFEKKETVLALIAEIGWTEAFAIPSLATIK